MGEVATVPAKLALRVWVSDARQFLVFVPAHADLHELSDVIQTTHKRLYQKEKCALGAICKAGRGAGSLMRVGGLFARVAGSTLAAFRTAPIATSILTTTCRKCSAIASRSASLSAMPRCATRL